MTTIHLSRPWYCLDPLVDDWRTVYDTGGDLYMLRTLKVIRSIIVNLGLIAIIWVTLTETIVAPTLVFTLGVSTLALYNGIEVGDYIALTQAISEIHSQEAPPEEADEDSDD